MRVNIMTSNTLHKQLVDEINIIYYTSDSLFDQILYLIDNNYFVLANVPSSSENCRCITELHMDMYDYDVCCSTNVVSYKDRSNLVSAMHISDLYFEHHYRNSGLKKEDVYIINQNLRNSKKVFFNKFVAESWGLNNSLVVEYGIPTNFFNINDSEPQKDVLILTSNNQSIAGQLQHHVMNNLKLKADCAETLAFAKLEDINKLFNDYKIIVNLTNYTVNSLCAVSSGASVIALAQENPNDVKLKGVPNLHNCLSVQDVASKIDTVNKTHTKSDSANKYVNENYNFDRFKSEMQGIFDTVKREAFVL